MANRLIGQNHPTAVPHIPGGTGGEFSQIRASFKAVAANVFTDVVKIQVIPKDFVVVGGHIDVIVASGVATSDVDIGFTGNDDAFTGTPVDINVVAVTNFLEAEVGIGVKASKTANLDLIATLLVADPGIVEFDVLLWGFAAPGEGVSE